jgi:LMBR1-like membrane protein
LAFTISYLPFLMVPLDVATPNDQGLMRILWEGLLVTQVVCVWVLFPILIVYYESNENDGLSKKIKRSMQVAIPMFLFLVLVTVPTYFWLRDVRRFL